MNPWHKLANWANPYGSGFSKRLCPSNKAGRETEGDTRCQCHLCRLEVSERTPSSSHPCSLSCPLHLLPLQVHFWPPSCLLLSHSLPMVPPPPAHVGHSLPGLFPFRLWGDSWAAWVMEANLGITREITGKTALRGAREGRREEGTWDTGDEGEVCTRLPGTSGEPCPGSLLWGPPF